MSNNDTIFADQSQAAKIFVHINDDEIEHVPTFEEVFSSDDEDDDDEQGNVVGFYYIYNRNIIQRRVFMIESRGIAKKITNAPNEAKELQTTKSTLIPGQARLLFYSVSHHES